MQNTLENRIRDSIKTSEQRLFEIRRERPQYFSIVCEKLVADSRYSSKIQELQIEEKSLLEKIITREAALKNAGELAAKVNPLARSAPYSWLQDRIKALKSEIGNCKTEATLLQRQIEENQNITGYNKVDRRGVFHAAPDRNPELSQRVRDYENRIKEFGSELVRVEAAFREVESCLQGAGV